MPKAIRIRHSGLYRAQSQTANQLKKYSSFNTATVVRASCTAPKMKLA